MGNQQPLKFTSKSYLTTITILYGAIIFGILFFAVVAYFQFGEGAKLDLSYSEDSFFFLVPLLFIGSYFVGDMLFVKKIAALDMKSTLKNKLSGFQTALIIKLALLEVPAFSTIAVFIFQKNVYYLWWAGLAILYLMLLRPTKERIIATLKLNRDERDQLSDPDTVID